MNRWPDPIFGYKCSMHLSRMSSSVFFRSWSRSTRSPGGSSGRTNAGEMVGNRASLLWIDIPVRRMIRFDQSPWGNVGGLVTLSELLAGLPSLTRPR